MQCYFHCEMQIYARYYVKKQDIRLLILRRNCAISAQINLLINSRKILKPIERKYTQNSRKILKI